MQDADLVNGLSTSAKVAEAAVQPAQHGTADLHRPERFAGEIISPSGPGAIAGLNHDRRDGHDSIVTWKENSQEVDALIERARAHPLGVNFLVQGYLGSVAATFRAHAFTVEAARNRLGSTRH